MLFYSELRTQRMSLTMLFRVLVSIVRVFFVKSVESWLNYMIRCQKVKTLSLLIRPWSNISLRITLWSKNDHCRLNKDIFKDHCRHQWNLSANVINFLFVVFPKIIKQCRDHHIFYQSFVFLFLYISQDCLIIKVTLKCSLNKPHKITFCPKPLRFMWLTKKFLGFLSFLFKSWQEFMPRRT